MTIFHHEGFETIGTTATTGANIEARYNKIPVSLFQETGGGHTGDVALINDHLSVGLALQMPITQTSRGSFFRNAWASPYNVTTNAAHPVMVTGFRFYNYASSPAASRTIWSYMTAATSPAINLIVASNDVDLVYSDTTGSVTIVGALGTAAWHYIEVEWKPTTSALGGYAKVFVDGTEVYSSGSRNTVAFSFSASFGTRIGILGTANEASGQSAFDDWYQMSIDGVLHTARLGAVRVLRLTPTSDATPNDWARSSGSTNFSLIDEQTWDTADYVEASTTGNKDHYGLTTLAGTSTVHALQIDAVCQGTVAGRTLHVGFDNGTLDDKSGGVIGTATTAVVRKFFATDPSGAAWTQSNVNAIEAVQRMTL